jgi:hypothetical protein
MSQADTSGRRKSDTPIGYSGRTALRREQYDMTPESKKNSLLGNSSLSTLPWQRVSHDIRKTEYFIASQRLAKKHTTGTTGKTDPYTKFGVGGLSSVRPEL